MARTTVARGAVAGLAALSLTLGCALIPGTAGASAAAVRETCAAAGETSTDVPWAQQALAPERAWPFTRGARIVVAVLDSGVDANAPQLRGRVSPGLNVVTGSGPAQDDCAGHGTAVAGVIGARQAGTTGFGGIAPDVTILPIRVAVTPTSGTWVAPPDVLARGVTAAVALGATVIAVSTITYTDTAELRDAVAQAQTQAVTVIAAVGDLGGAGDENPTPYPAAYPGVIGVGAVGRTGERWEKSQHGAYVDLVAPGAEVTTLQRGQGTAVVSGTGVACGFVAGAAALIRAKRGASATPAEIRRVLQATAVANAGGAEYGHGLVNPYAAVTEQLIRATPRALPGLGGPPSDAPSAWARSRQVAIAGTGIALLAVLGVAFAALTLPRGRRRFWRSSLAPRPQGVTEPDEPGPPLRLFEDGQQQHGTR